MGFAWVFLNSYLSLLLMSLCFFSCVPSMADTGEAARCSDVGVGELKADSILLDLERRKKKRAHLLREAQAAQRKAL